MTTVTLDISSDVYNELRKEAGREGKSVEIVAHEWLLRYLKERQQEQNSMSERDRFTAMLRAHGLLSEPTPEQQARAAICTVTLEEVQEALTRAGGPPLSEIVIAQRGPLV